MFKSLTVVHGFYDQPRVHIEFARGLNVITAKNGSGKSHTLECLNYSLFGVQALRSSINDYKQGFSVECVVSINNRDYKIRRTKSSARIYNTVEGEWSLLAEGITPVNNCIKELLTYDLKIYNLTNYCSQDGLLDVTRASSNALVNLIDTVSGVELSEGLDKYLREKVSSARANKKALESTKEDYEERLKGEFSEGSDEVIKAIEDKINFKEELLGLREDLSVAKAFLKTGREVFSKYTQSDLELNKFREFENIPIQALTESLKAVRTAEVEYKTLLAQRDKIKTIEDKYTEEELSRQEELIDLNKRYKDYLDLKKKMEDHKVTCPECDHEFYNTSDMLEDMEEPEKPSLTLNQIREARDWNDNADRYRELTIEINKLKLYLDSNPSVKDIDEQINNYNIYIKANEFFIESRNTLARFIEEVSSSVLYIPISDDIENMFDEYTVRLIDELETQLKDRERLSNEVIEYQASLKSKSTIDRFLRDVEEKVSSANKKLELYSTLYDTLKSTKKFVQSQSLPMISTLASDLVSTLTQGERNTIEVKEDFSIELDGKDVNVAEMSAQVISNVALRFGILNTFHKDSLGVFIGDEIDSPLHEDRFSYLGKCFEGLVGLGYQIILVSHKDFDRGNIIELKGEASS